VQAHDVPDHWIVLSLFEIMCVLDHQFRFTSRETCQPDMWYNGKYIRGSVIITGAVSLLFEHKVADMASIPTLLFTLGPTLRRALESHCPSMLCSTAQLKHLRVAVTPLWAVLDALDFNPLKSKDPAMRWVMSRPTDSGRSFTCSHAALKPALEHPLALKPALVNVASMPMFAPALLPSDACGQDLSMARQRADQGDWWALKEAEWLSLMGPNGEETTARCINAPYKVKLRARLQALRRQGKCEMLADMLGVASQ
jgi:hypothetical protein